MRRKWTTGELEVINSGLYTAVELSEVFEVPPENIRSIGNTYRRTGKRWSSEETEKLLDMLKKRYPKSQICKVLDRSIHGVNRKLRQLDKNSFKFWTKEELEFLEENYKTMLYKDIAKVLGRTEQSIKRKMENLRSKGKKLEFKENIGNPKFGRELILNVKKY